MLTSLRVRDYQSIKEADIELAPFTVIVGKSRSGKSAALRSLKGAIFNETGDDLIRWGQKEASVEVETSEGDVIKWVKTRTSAEYDLNGNRYTKLAGGVPDDIANAFGIRAIVVDATLTLTPQIHEQGQYAFLVDRSAGQAAKALAKMTRLDIVVKAQQHCKSAIKTIRDNIRANKLMMDKLEPELDAWDTDENERRIRWVDTASSTIIPMHNKLFEHDKGHKAMLVLAASEAIMASEDILPEWSDVDENLATLSKTLHLVEELEKKEIDVPDLSNIDMPVVFDGLTTLINEDKAKAETVSVEKELESLWKSLRIMEKELEAIDVCPVCGK